MSIDPNKVAKERKRSSLRQNNLFQDLSDPKDFQEWINRQKKKSLKWDTKVEEPGAHQGTGISSIKLKDAQPVDSVEDANSDIYLSKLATVNKIEPTKEIVEEIVKLVEEGEPKKEVMDNIVLISDTPTKTTGSDYEEKKRRSIKDEFTIAQELLQMNIEDELEPEIIEETMKNTFYNKVLGKLERDEYEECGEDSDNEK